MNETVSILLSLYKPDPDYLKQQLLSLNRQSYPSLKLIVWNDSPSVPIDHQLFTDCITNFPVEFHEDGKNHGYCEAFEKLTSLCDTPYLTYCDQDDIWHPDKIKNCLETLKKDHSLEAVCDRAIIDGQGKLVQASVRHSSRQHNETWESLSDITILNTFLCCANGLCILAETKAAQACIPFIKKTGHDKWVTLYCASHGTVSFVDQPLVYYRRHGSNVSGIMKGVNCKKDYYTSRLGAAQQIVGEFAKRWPNDKHVSIMQNALAAQLSHDPIKIFKVRKAIPDLYLFQMALAVCPDPLFRLALKVLHKK